MSTRLGQHEYSPDCPGLVVLETRWEDVIPTLATKADLEKAVGTLRAEMKDSTASLIKWIVGTGIAGFVLFTTIMTFVLNNAIPQVTMQAVQPPPITAPIAPPPPAQAQAQAQAQD